MKPTNFVQHIEMRVKRHTARVPFVKNSKVLVVGELAQHLVSAILKNFPIELTFKDVLPKKTDQFDRIVTQHTLDDENFSFLKAFFSDMQLPRDRRTLHLLLPISDAQAASYAKAKNIYYKPFKKSGPIWNFYINIVNKYPDAKNRLVKTSQELFK